LIHAFPALHGANVNKKIVLVAEDETDLRKMMKILLEIHGFYVIEAADGYEAVEKAVDGSPNLILMDMAMPVMSGLDSARTIRLHAELNDIPIIAVTAYGDFYDERARQAGCTDVLRKPLDFGQLKPIVERYIN
jgi:two-component system, cell cycle response regulator DivK